MHDLTVVSSLLGGLLIGMAAALLLWTHGRIAGISGIFAGLWTGGASDRSFRRWFVVGLLAVGGALRWLYPAAFDPPGVSPVHRLVIFRLILAGLLVGFGTRLGGGCTSGHGVCGVGRLSPRSVIATGTFMALGFVTVYILRHRLPALLGVGP